MNLTGRPRRNLSRKRYGETRNMNVTAAAQTPVFRIRMAADPEQLDSLLDAMSLLEPPPGSWQDVDSGESWIEAFCTTQLEADDLALQMARIAEAIDGKPHAAAVSQIESADWTEKWKSFFHVLHVTDRVTIRPLWEEYNAAPGEIVIDIEPGMSFGTGLHPTTQSCIRLLQYLAEDVNSRSRTVVDMGCGTGILAIAARKLGFNDVSGYDNDPAAVRIARENAEMNKLTIPFEEGDALASELPRGDIIAANILSPILLRAAKNFRLALNDGGKIILSGILDNQYNEIKRVYESEGLVEVKTLLSGEWRSGLFALASTTAGDQHAQS